MDRLPGRKPTPLPLSQPKAVDAGRKVEISKGGGRLTPAVGCAMPEYRVILGECEPVLAELPSKGVAIITDPPYGINLKADYNRSTRLYPNGKRRIPLNQYAHANVVGDDKPFNPTHLLQFETVVIFGAENYADKLPVSRRWFIWDKRCGIIPPRNQGDCEVAWVKGEGVMRVFRHVWDGMVRDSEHGQRRVHPTQKPVALFKWIITQLELPPDTLIVDPYLGSGSCGVAAGELGYNFLGVEIVEQYYKAALKRISAAFAQPLLINAHPTLH